MSVVLLLLTWRTLALTPQPSLDNSWRAGLHMAAHMNLVWGRDVVFTYGPLGFLDNPVYYYDDTGALALVFRIATHLVLLGLLWVTLSRYIGVIWAFLFLLVAGALLDEPLLDDPLPLIAFALATSYVLAEPARRRGGGLAFPAVMGTVGGAAMLIKINSGATTLALVAVAALAVGSRRRTLEALGAATGGAVIGLLAGWIVTGQPLAALPDYVHNAARVVSGYSATMQLEDPSLRWQLTSALALLLIAGGVCFTSTQPRARWVFALFGVLAFFMYKEGFVRHDAVHGSMFFGAMLVAFAFLPWGGVPRTTAVALLASVVVITLATTARSIDDVVTPSSSVSSAWSQISTLWRPGERSKQREAGRAAILARDGVDARATSLLRRGTVSVWPSETAIVWALGLRWKPAPVFQNYDAYTQGLDALDAKVLSAPDGPDRILYSQGGEPDGRLASFDTPQAARALLCHYRVEDVQSQARAVLLRRHNRCGPTRLIGSVRAAWGQAVPVPAPPGPRDVVTAKVAGVQVQGAEKIRAAAYKAQERSVILDGDATVPHRLAPGTAGDGLVVRAAPAADYPSPLNLAPNATTIAFQRQGAPAGGTPLRVDFYAMRVRP